MSSSYIMGSSERVMKVSKKRIYIQNNQAALYSLSLVFFCQKIILCRYFFLFQEESLDVVRAGAVCEKMIVPNETAVGRAGATAEFAQNRVLLCGGKDHQVKINYEGCV